MPEVILHHYELSPFSEKIRRILGHKKMAWRSVDAPMLNPKPKLTPLTGGYRRIPVLQIGADVYCDTSLIARVLERVQPEPTIFPDGCEAEATLLAQWADRLLFPKAVPVTLAAVESFLTPEFKTDREAMTPQLQFDRIKEAVPDARNQVRALLHTLGQLLEGRPFLLGERFSLADAAVYNPIWFLQNAPDAKAMIRAHAPIAEWFKRCGALGRGEETPLDADEALSIARDAEPDTAEQGDPGDPNGARPGDQVTILPDDYAFDPIKGRLVALDALEMAVRREAQEVGEVVVHFPRVGYRILPASS